MTRQIFAAILLLGLTATFAAAQAVPIGTVLWRVFNAQKKLAPYLKTGLNDNRKAA